MDVKRSSRLPEGVGKKIVEALKRQSEQAQENEFDSYEETELSKQTESFDYYEEKEEVSPFEEAEESTEDYEFSSAGTEEYQYEEESFDDELTGFDFEEETEESEQEYPAESFESKQQIHYEAPVQSAPSIEFPKNFTTDGLKYSPNVDILIQLISQLPTGVTRQTGAQIIRQTMEAMGVSMHKLLSEAQQAQDELNSSIKNNMYTIEEYRNNIRILEKDVQISRKKSDELEDLISLFILSEKETKK